MLLNSTLADDAESVIALIGSIEPTADRPSQVLLNFGKPAWTVDCDILLIAIVGRPMR